MLPQASGTDDDDEVGFVQLPAEPRHLTLSADLKVLPQVQHNLSGDNGEANPFAIARTPAGTELPHRPALHLAAAEVLQEVGEALDDAAVSGAVSVRVADEDLGPGPRAFRVQSCALIGRLAAFFVQLAVDVF